MGIKGRVVRGVLTLAAGAIAGVLLAPKAGKEMRRELKVTATKVKRDVATRVAVLEKLSKKAYEEIVADVLRHYKKVRGLSEVELRELKRDLNARWQDITKEAKKTQKPTTKKRVPRKRSVKK